MKKLVLALMIVLFTVSIGFSDHDGDAQLQKKDAGVCPVTKIKGSAFECFRCHVTGSFKIREQDPFATWDLPLAAMKMTMINEEPVCTYSVTGVIHGEIGASLNKMFEYLSAYHPEVTKVNINIHSGGGSLFGGYQAFSVLRSWSPKFEITTMVHGFAASAAFYIFCGGEERLVGKSSQLMWHSLKVFKMFDVATPDSREEEARILRHLQDCANTIISELSTLTKEEVDKMIKNKELWVGADKAVEYGFATGYL